MPKQNYITPIGDDFFIFMNFYQADGVTAENITGAVIDLILKTSKYLDDDDSSNIIFQASLSNPTAGQAVIQIPAATTETYSGTFYYKLKITLNGVTTISYGVFTFTTGSTGQSNGSNALSINISAGIVISNIFKQDQFIPTNGQTAFTLSLVPQANSVNVFLNGVLATPVSDYTFTGRNLTWAGRSLTTTDALLVAYAQT